MPSKPGYGTRYDALTANAIDKARESAPGPGLYQRMGDAFCAKCQQQKSTKGGSRRHGMFFCCECGGKK
jgi:hypothetical protein